MPTDGSDYYNQLVKEDKRHGRRKKRNGELETPTEGPGTRDPAGDGTSDPTDSSGRPIRDRKAKG